MRYETMTTDELLEILQWIADRARYHIACGMPLSGATYGEDAKAERLVLRELTKRGL